jgi:hypothetical protein
MADAQIGNHMGVAAVDNIGVKLADISAEGVNTFTVGSAAQLRNFEVGMNIDFRTAATGALVANRNVTQINNTTNVIVYDGADAATTTAEDVFLGGQSPVAASLPKSNLNGGASAQAGLELSEADTIFKLRARLKAISATTYSDAELNKMTYNDMVYALRVNDAAGSIK